MIKRWVAGIIGLGICLSLSGCLGGETLYGKGKEIKVEGKNVVNLDGMEVKVNYGGYFNGEVKEIMKDVHGMGKNDGYVVLDVDVKNKENENNKMVDVNILDKNKKMLGTSIFVYEDPKLPYSLKEEVIRKYKLLLNGREFIGKEKREGVLYIPVKKMKEGEKFYIEYSNGSRGKVLKAEITGENFKDDGIKKIKNIKSKKELNVKIGELKKGRVVDVENKVVEAEGLKIKFHKAVLFNKVPDELKDGLMHLTSVNGMEKVLLIDTEIENTTKEEAHVGSFWLLKDGENGQVQVEALKTIAAPRVGEGVVNYKLMEKYRLLNYRGFGNHMTPLKPGEKIRGNIIFYTIDLEDYGNYELEYKGIEKVSDKVKVTLK